MRKLLITFLFCASSAMASSCAAQASGSYLTAATWASCGGGTPGASDTVTIGSNYIVTCSGTCAAQTVTLTAGSTARLVVASGGALSVGATTAGTVISVGSGTDLNVQNGGTLVFGNDPGTDETYNLSPGLHVNGGTVEFAGTITAFETIGLRSGGALLCHGDGLLEFNPRAGGTYTVLATYPFAPWGQVNADAPSWAHPCTMRTRAGAAGSNFSFRNYGGASLKFNLDYADLTHNCGDGNFCIWYAPTLVLNHVRFSGNGVAYRSNTSAPDAGDGFRWSYVSFRNISSGYNVSAWLNNTGQTPCQSGIGCTADHVSVYSQTGGNEARFVLDVGGATITNSTFVGNFNEASGVGGNTMTGNLFSADDSAGDTYQMVAPLAGGGSTYSNNIWLYPDCFAAGGQKCHGAIDGGTSLNKPNLFIDDILDGGGYTAGGHAIGNWASPYGPYNIVRLLAINGYASISNAIGPTTFAGDLNHITSVAASTAAMLPANGEGPLSQEVSTHAYQWGAYHNSISANQLFNVQHGGASGGFKPQYNATVAATGCTFSATSNVITVAGCSNTLPATAAPNIPAITCTGLLKNTWLNGVTMTPNAPVTATGWTATVGGYTHADYSAMAETGGTCYAGFYYDDNISYSLSPAGFLGGYNVWNPAANKPGSLFANPVFAPRLSFGSNGNSNGSDCSAVLTAGTLSGTIVGDYMFKTIGSVGPAMVLTVPSSTSTTLGTNPASAGTNGLGAGNCPNGQGMTVAYNFWAAPSAGTSKSYGDPGKGANEQIGLNPAHYCPTCTTATWDATLAGGNSTLINARDQISCNVAEQIGPTGSACTADPSATVANLAAYLRRAYTPFNGQLLNAAPDGLTYGAVAAYPAAIIQ